MLGNEGYITLMEHFMCFDENMRLSNQVQMIDGWDFEIKYINYDIPRPVKRQRTL